MSVSAKSLDDYYQKANNFTDKAPFSFKEGNDTVHFDPKLNKYTVIDINDNLKTFRVETNKNKIDNGNYKVRQITDG